MWYPAHLAITAVLLCSGSTAAETEAPRASALGLNMLSTRKSVISRSAVSSPFREVLVRDAVVEGGGVEPFDSTSDFNGAERIAIAVVGNDISLKSVRIAVLWAAADEWFAITDMLRCDMFYYSDHGGFTVLVYGPYLRIALINDGTTPIKIKQLSVYAVRH